jgi:mono/diheme cytochrome c family protein
MKRLGFALAVVVSCCAFAHAGDRDGALIKKGEQLLEKNCHRCHAIGRDDTSTHPKSPPFRDVVKRYPAANLAESLAEGIVSGHPDMPEFVFEPDEIEAIVMYLDHLGAQN